MCMPHNTRNQYTLVMDFKSLCTLCRAASQFLEAAFLHPLADGVDVLNNLHANTHLAKVSRVAIRIVKLLYLLFTRGGIKMKLQN